MNTKKKNNLLLEIRHLFIENKLTTDKRIEIIGDIIESELTTIALIGKVNFDILDAIEFMEKYKNLMNKLVSGTIRENHNEQIQS